ncbi:hypothetical protein [Parvicella tangerina]|uniref:Uncharacterized protein n=1 Tax=Parvicella tangerina TaxID=2829795 RepID=A0A916JKN1_9FLAO|nr:hypothetical protein [Parvicella tangerina]CAG5078687.1 hypothetical protein CRYO30217_00741 [Parvicella tangerina]
MAYENLEQLKELESVLERLDELIEDEDFFRSDVEGYVIRYNECINQASNILDEVLENDPEIPIAHETFFEKAPTFTEEQILVYEELEGFGLNQLNEFRLELAELLEDAQEKPRKDLFNQLTIPVLSLVNHQEHPTRPGYLVYHFKIPEHASYFEELMNERGLFYERFDEQRNGEDVYWFGVRDGDHDAVEIINYTVKGKFRKPLIRDKGARYFVIGFGILIILLAIVGAIMSNL